MLRSAKYYHLSEDEVITNYEFGDSLHIRYMIFFTSRSQLLIIAESKYDLERVVKRLDWFPSAPPIQMKYQADQVSNPPYCSTSCTSWRKISCTSWWHYHPSFRVPSPKSGNIWLPIYVTQHHVHQLRLWSCSSSSARWHFSCWVSTWSSVGKTHRAAPHNTNRCVLMISWCGLPWPSSWTRVWAVQSSSMPREAS